MNNSWVYEDGLYQSIEPIPVFSLGGSFDVWFDVEERLIDQQSPSSKQQATWDEFCNISTEVMRQQFIKGLADLAQRMDELPDTAKPQFGPAIYPKVMAKEIREALSIFNKTSDPIGKQPDSALICDSIVIPMQDNAPVGFVVVNFQIGFGKRADKSYGYELEALFCNGDLLFVGESSGLWTRIDWEHRFNISDFDPNTAVHTYW